MNKLNQIKKWIATTLNASRNQASGNQANKKSQYINLGIVGLVMVVMVCIFILFRSHQIETNIPQFKSSTFDKKKAKNITFASADDHINQQTIWIQRAENRLAQEHKKEEKLQQTQQTAGEQLTQQSQVVKKQQAQIDFLVKELTTIKQQMIAQKNASEHALASNHAGNIVQPVGSSGQNGSVEYFNGPQMMNHSIQLVSREKAPRPIKKTPKTWVPPGAFVTAVVLQGVAASASVSSQSDPRPVLLRTISRGTLPGHYHSDLKDCFLVGSGYGDISSERVYVRLETMSCTRHGIEIGFPVYGYVAGTDALTGQRGPVVFRDKPFLERAFLGGVLAGVGSIGQQYSQNFSVSPLGAVTTLNPSRIPIAAASSGFGTAGQMYAQYNIKRAEQYQPVVEFDAGNIVNIVFTKGFWLDGHHTHTGASGYAQTTSNRVSTSQSNLVNQLSQLQKNTRAMSNERG